MVRDMKVAGREGEGGVECSEATIKKNKKRQCWDAQGKGHKRKGEKEVLTSMTDTARDS